MRGFLAHQAEIGAGCHHHRSLVHHIFVRHVGVGEDNLIHLQILDEFQQIAFGMDGDALRVILASQGGG